MERLTTLSAEELELLLLVQPRIYGDYRDPRRGKMEMVYIFSETSDNADSCFIRAVELEQSGTTNAIGIAEGDLGYGFDASVMRLKSFGFQGKVPIEKFNIGGNVNTMSEAQKLASYAKSQRGDIGIIAPSFHLFRAFVTAITALEGHPTRIYAIPGVPSPWLESVRHSQGVVTDTRAGLLSGELERLEKYREPQYGSMLSANGILHYLNWRDA